MLENNTFPAVMILNTALCYSLAEVCRLEFFFLYNYSCAF